MEKTVCVAHPGGLKKLFIKKTLIKAMHHVKYQIVATQNNKDINEANCIFFHNLQHELKLS